MAHNPHQSAAILADVTSAWAKMLEGIGLEVEASITINETRAKPQRAPRKPRIVPTTEKDVAA